MIAAGDARARTAWMIVPASAQRFDGLRDFVSRLSAALSPSPAAVTFTTRDDCAPYPDTRVLSGWSDLAAIDAAPGAAFVHYYPQAWLRRDTISLLKTLRRIRGAGARVIVIAHEYQIDPGPSIKRIAGRRLFRSLARAFARRADVFVTSHAFVAALARADGLDRFCAVTTIPIGSNLDDPDPRVPARATRVVTFGQPASMSASMTAAALRAAAARGWDAVWCCRGAGEATAWLARNGIPAAHIKIAAGLSNADVSRELAQASIALAPIDDGVSTRRSSVAAYLQHRLPIVGTRGRTTEPAFGDSAAFELAPVGDPAAMTRAMERVMDDEARRREMGAAARALFDGELSWPRIAARYRELAF